VDHLEHAGPVRAVGPHLDHQQLALHRGVPLELDDLEDVNQLVELLRDLLERQLSHVHHHGDPGDLRVLRRADCERVDVERSAREEAGNAREHAGLVLDEH
jgi:hypothetical protein